MEKESLKALLRKHLDGTLTDSEKTELAAFMKKKNHKELMTSSMEELMWQQSSEIQFDERRYMPLLSGIFRADSIPEQAYTNDPKIPEIAAGRKSTMWMVITGIILLIALAVIGYFFFIKSSQAKSSSRLPGSDNIKRDLVAGSNKASLTLSDGSLIALDDSADGIVGKQSNTTISELSGGWLVYQASGDSAVVLYNTLSTPRGGEYRLQLTDGSVVKLNSSSSITYPSSFLGKERNVTITGEAFFEIVQDDSRPFKVKVFDLEVESQANHFNISAYSDEASIKVTPTKGSIKILKDTIRRVIQPSQQAQFDYQGLFTLNKIVDTAEVVSWKKGYFKFEETDVKTAMRQLGRWYDVEVVYEEPVINYEPVTCELRRDQDLPNLVEQIGKCGVKTRIEQNKLIVSP